MAHNFFAFISYRHTDIKAAKRLQFLLESYNLPTMIQKMKLRHLNGLKSFVMLMN